MMKKLLAAMVAVTLMAGMAWAGDAEFVWSGTTGANWADSGKWTKDGVASSSWSDAATSNATFNLTTGQTVVIAAATTAGDVTVTGGSNAWAFTTTAVLTADTLTVDGTGTKLTLSTANNVQTDSVTIKNGGILSIGDAKSLTGKNGSGTTDLILNNGTLDATATMTIASDIELAGGTNTITASGATSLSGVISGAGKLVLSGSPFTMGGAANTYTGGTTINNTTVTFSNEDHFGTGDITFTGATTGLTVATTSGMDVANNMVLSGAANTTIDHSAVTELKLSGNISGEKGLTIVGTSGGNITLAGTNTYEGGTTIQGGGSVSIASNANLGAAAGGITIGTTGAILKLLGNITDMDRVIATGAGNALTIAAGNYNLTNAGSVTGTGALTVTGNNTTETVVSLGDLSGHNTGAITVGATDKVALEATKLGTANISLNSENNKIIVNNADAVTYNTATVTGNGAFIKKGAGDFTLGSAVLTAKNIDIQDGTFIVGSTGTFGLTGTGKVTVFDGAKLNVAAAGATLAAAAMELKAGSTLVLDGTLTATGGQTLDFSSDSILKAGNDAVTGNVITFGTIGTGAKLDGAAYNATAFQNYLDKFATTGLVRDVEFGVSGNNITATITTVTDHSGAVAGVMAEQGIGDMTTYAAPFADAWAGIYEAYAANPASITDPIGEKTAQLISKLADGGFKLGGDVRGAEAATNFLTGMDMAKSIDVAGQTAHRAVGNVFKRIQQNNTLRTAMNDTYGSGNAYANSVLNADYANRFWLAGMGMWEDGDRYNGNAGYNYDAYGMQLGYDRVFGAFTFGGSFSYANGDYEDKAALANDSTIENYTFNLYGTYNHCSGFFASVVGGYTYSDYAMNSLAPIIGWNRADYGMDTWTIGTTLGYDIRPVTNFTITPTIGLYHYASHSDTFNNTGINGIQIESDRTELPLALSMKYDVAVNDCSKLTFEVNGGYTYSFSDEGGKVSALGYNGLASGRATTTLKATRHSYNIGAGVNYSAVRWDAGLKYDYYTSKASDAHVLRAEVGFKF